MGLGVAAEAYYMPPLPPLHNLFLVIFIILSCFNYFNEKKKNRFRVNLILKNQISKIGK